MRGCIVRRGKASWRVKMDIGHDRNGKQHEERDADIHGFARLHEGGIGWGSGNYTTSVAAGDVDGDGLDEVIIGRHSNVNMRYEILEISQS